jgi:hypothetical protein
VPGDVRLGPQPARPRRMASLTQPRAAHRASGDSLGRRAVPPTRGNFSAVPDAQFLPARPAAVGGAAGAARLGRGVLSAGAGGQDEPQGTGHGAVVDGMAGGAGSDGLLGGG